MKIFKMERDDLPSVNLLANQLGYPTSLQEIQDRFQSILNHPDYALYVAKSTDHEILGWIQINKQPLSLLTGPTVEVAALVVDENCRGQGIGKALLQVAEKWALENNITTVQLRSNISRQDAHRFYVREGYDGAKQSILFTKKLTKK